MAVGTVYYDGERSTLYPNGDVKVGGHPNWRNNNPGNIKANGSYAKSQGSVGQAGAFAVFNSMEEGYAAQENLIHNGVNYKNLTMSEMVHRYAPSSDSNNPGAYTAYLASRTGISPNKVMSDMTDEEIHTLTRSMSVYEGMKAGTLIAGADVDGNKVTGGSAVDDPSAIDPNDPSFANYPLCSPSQTPEAGATKKIAQTEGNGKYVQEETTIGNFFEGPSGRYQMDQDTAIGLLIELGRVTSVEEGEELWEKCRGSTYADCQRLQDDLADRFVSKLKEADNRYMLLYLSWKVGPTTTKEIMASHNSNGWVTNSVRRQLMDAQPWNVDQPSNGNTEVFFNNLEKYIIERGVDPQSRI